MRLLLAVAGAATVVAAHPAWAQPAPPSGQFYGTLGYTRTSERDVGEGEQGIDVDAVTGRLGGPHLEGGSPAGRAGRGLAHA